MKFGENIRNLREVKKLTQEDLADMVGVSRQTISKWECDESPPRWSNIPALCSVFHCNLDDLVSGEELKKIIDLEKLKEQSMKIDGTDVAETIRKMEKMGVDPRIIEMFPKNSYDDFVNLLEDFYISKSDGMERIKDKLNGWDIKARKTILIILMNRVKESGIIFTVEDVIELAELI